MKKLLNWLFREPAIEIEVGQKWIDKLWEDTVIEIQRVSPNKTDFKYKYLKIVGKDVEFENGNYSASIELLKKFKLYN